MKKKSIGAAAAFAVLAMAAVQAHADSPVNPEQKRSARAEGAQQRFAAPAHLHEKAQLRHGAHGAAHLKKPGKPPRPHPHTHHGKHKQHVPFVYGGVNLGHGSSGIDGLEKSKTAYGLVLGTQVNRRFAVEAAYQDLGKRRFTDGTVGAVSTEAFSLSALGFVPVAKDVRAYGKVGLAHTSATVAAGGARVGISNTAPVLGAGLDWRLNKRASLRTAVDVYPDFAGSDNTLTNFTVGVNYRF